MHAADMTHRVGWSDMTVPVEAICAKLGFLYGLGLDNDQVGNLRSITRIPAWAPHAVAHPQGFPRAQAM